MYEKLTEQEIEFMEMFYTPDCLIENLIPENIDAPSSYNLNTDCVSLRLYQYAMIAYDYMYADDESLTDRENFQRKTGAGQLFCIGSRNTGKTFISFDIDAILNLIYQEGSESCISSFDAHHLNPRMERIGSIVENHPFFEMYKLRGRKQTVNLNRGITTALGHIMKKANEKVSGDRVGEAYHGMHFKRFIYDEISYSSEEGEQKRVDSKHSHGVINRFCGIPDLHVGSPLGKILKTPKNKPWIWRLPQFVREDWDKKAFEESVEKYQGENSVGFKLNVLAELTEGAYSRYDMTRIRKECVNPQKRIKFFEIGQNNYKRFRNVLAIDRLPCDEVIIASDVGSTGSPSEIAIFFKVDNKYKYHYQISLFKLSAKEQAYVFKFLYDKMGEAYIALDCGDVGGRDIREYLVDMGIPTSNLPEFDFRRNLEVGIQRDKDGKTLCDKNGNPIKRTERTKPFAVQLLEKLFYTGKIEIPVDEKLFKQIADFIEFQRNNQKIYDTKSEDHLMDSFLYFALCDWYNKEMASHEQRPKRCLGVIK